MGDKAYLNFAEAYAASLGELLVGGEAVAGVRDSTSVGSSFGEEPRPTVELRPFAVKILEPADCLALGSARQSNLVYMVAQWLWVMRGSDSVDEIAFYNQRARQFSDDGDRLSSAFGLRLRRPKDQLTAALDVLRADPTSRRALMVLARPDDVSGASRDHCCALSMQLLIRGNKLEAITTMRSQSALMVFPYDAALFMTIHVWAAAALGMRPGPHSWIANSFHLYEDELALAKRVRATPPQASRLPAIGLEVVTNTRRLQSLEQTLRAAVEHADPGVFDTVDISGLDPLHASFGNVLIANAAARLMRVDVVAQALGRLPSTWRDPLATTLATPVRASS